jgi:hypothetical protein
MRKFLAKAGLAAGAAALIFGIGAPAGAQSVCVRLHAEIQDQVIDQDICLPPEGAPGAPEVPVAPEVPEIPVPVPDLPLP